MQLSMNQDSDKTVVYLVHCDFSELEPEAGTLAYRFKDKQRLPSVLHSDWKLRVCRCR
jgi:hypothetical protein